MGILPWYVIWKMKDAQCMNPMIRMIHNNNLFICWTDLSSSKHSFLFIRVFFSPVNQMYSILFFKWWLQYWLSYILLLKSTFHTTQSKMLCTLTPQLDCRLRLLINCHMKDFGCDFEIAGSYNWWIVNQCWKVWRKVENCLSIETE
jgi:hypothetical protein